MRTTGCLMPGVSAGPRRGLRPQPSRRRSRRKKRSISANGTASPSRSKRPASAISREARMKAPHATREIAAAGRFDLLGDAVPFAEIDRFFRQDRRRGDG